MTQTEALKLARQLLWRYRHETPIGRQPHMICQEVDEAFERIDEALAQPEQEPTNLERHERNVQKFLGTQQPKEPEQEPVAWMSPNKESFVHVEDVGNSVPNWTDYYTIPLYTTQPQQKPLTDEQRRETIKSAWSEYLRGEGHDSFGWYLSQAIEAAHGIKGDA